jgi:uncharacterized OB-fold protein
MADREKRMSEPPRERVSYVTSNLYLPYDYIAADYRAVYLRALKDKKILGSRCSKTGKVLVPPMMSSPESMAPATEFVEVADRGVVRSFCIVNVPVYGRDLQLPYVCASVVLDGAALSIFALIQEVDVSEVRMGMRVEAVWKPDGERQGDHTDILHFRPTGESDVPRSAIANRG